MNEREPTTQMIEAEEARQQWDRILERMRSGNARVIVEQNGSPVAAIISPEDLERFCRFQEDRAERFRVLDEIGEAFADVPAEEIEREVARALAQVRAEERQRRSAPA